jgi:hypothetical protein
MILKAPFVGLYSNIISLIVISGKTTGTQHHFGVQTTLITTLLYIFGSERGVFQPSFL